MKSILLWLIGVALIVFLCFLSKDLLEDQNILYLDGGALICCYTLWLYTIGILFAPKEVFSDNVSSTGINMFTFSTYVCLVFLGIFIGYWYHLSFGIQLFYQLCFLFVVFLGALASNAASQKIVSVSTQSEMRHQTKNDLLLLAQQIQYSSSVNHSLPNNIKENIDKIVERIGYISPSDSDLAKAQEEKLNESLWRLSKLMTDTPVIERIDQEIELTNDILKQRIKTY